VKLRSDMLEPNRRKSKTETLEPSRLKLLIDSAEPKVTQSSTDRLEPKRTLPSTERLTLPNPLGNLMSPNTDIEEPILVNPLMDRVDPRCRQSKTESEAPSRAKLRSDIAEPKCA